LYFTTTGVVLEPTVVLLRKLISYWRWTWHWQHNNKWSFTVFDESA